MNNELKKVFDSTDLLKERIISDCKISQVTFWNWKNGNTPVPFWAKEKINLISKEIIGKEIFNEDN